jgi:DNA-binding Lrp family transcriptional regulator
VSETLLWDLMRGAMTAKALAWAADLKVPEALADGPRPVADLARSTGADPDALHRTLRALASDGVFAEDEARVFRNTDASELLGRDGWPEFAHLFGSVFYEALSRFPQGLESDFWEWLAAHPAERAAFDTAMAGGKGRYAERLAALDWQGTETLVDVGGGNGELLKGLLAHRPELRGIVFDLPETVRDESTFGDRLEFVAGSFFAAVPSGDAYVLSGILHDWNDERAGAILKTIRASAPDGARLLALESVVMPGNEPQGSKWLDLLMLVIGGREREEPEWRELIDAAGFAVESVEDGLIQATCR